VYRPDGALNCSELQIKKHRDAGGSEHERGEERVPRIGQCGALKSEQQAISDTDLLARDRHIELQGTLAVMSRPYGTTRLTPTPICAFALTPDHPESDSAS